MQPRELRQRKVSNMKKSDLLSNKVFKEADADLPIKYVQADGKEVKLGEVTWARMLGQIYWDASYASISKRGLLTNSAFCAARHDSEILIEFSDYRRETWNCDVELRDGFITIIELP